MEQVEVPIMIWQPPRCTVPSCAQPSYDGFARWRGVWPALVTDLLGRTYCPACNRTYKENK